LLAEEFWKGGGWPSAKGCFSSSLSLWPCSNKCLRGWAGSVRAVGSLHWLADKVCELEAGWACD